MRVATILIFGLTCFGCQSVTKPTTTPDPNPIPPAAMSRAQPLSVIAPTGSITLVPQKAIVQWSQEGSVEAYNLYYGEVSRFYDDGTGPTPYSNVINVFNATNCTVVGLSSASTYYFAVTAVDDQSGNESDFSEEVAYSTPLVMDVNFAFAQPVTNVTLQSSTDLRQWQDLGMSPTNGTWRLKPGQSPMTAYRGMAVSAQ